MLSKHVKWCASVWSKWIGANVCPMLGVVWVSPDKALRAIRELTALMAGALPLSELISLLGFLNHLGEILGIHPYLTRYLWAAHDAHVAEGWAMTDAVSLTSSQAGAAVQWRRAITNTPGTTMMRAWSRRQPPSYGLLTGWPVRSDACYDTEVVDGVVCAVAGAAPPGMGGDFHGSGWCHVSRRRSSRCSPFPWPSSSRACCTCTSSSRWCPTRGAW